MEIDDFEIDLRSLASNENKVIYDDGICRIYIKNVKERVSTGIDGELTDCFYTVELLATGRRILGYGRIVCGKFSLHGSISSQPISYQIDGESFNDRTISSYYGGTLKKNEIITYFQIKGGEKKQELYNMSKITIKFDEIFVNEWIKR